MTATRSAKTLRAGVTGIVLLLSLVLPDMSERAARESNAQTLIGELRDAWPEGDRDEPDSSDGVTLPSPISYFTASDSRACERRVVHDRERLSHCLSRGREPPGA